MLRRDLDAPEADPVAVVRRDPAGPVADPHGHQVAVLVDHDASVVEPSRTARSACADRGELEDACRRRGSPPPSRGRGTARPRPSRAAPPRSAGPCGRRRTRRPRRSRRRPPTDPSRAPSWPGGPSRWGSAAAASRRAARSRGRGRAPARARWASAGLTRQPDRGPRRHRLAGDDVGERDLHGRPGLGLHDAGAVAPRRAHAEHVGQRRPAAGSGLAAERPGGRRRAGPRRAGPDVCALTYWGSADSATVGILGCAEASAPVSIPGGTR